MGTFKKHLYDDRGHSALCRCHNTTKELKTLNYREQWEKIEKLKKEISHLQNIAETCGSSTASRDLMVKLREKLDTTVKQWNCYKDISIGPPPINPPKLTVQEVKDCLKRVIDDPEYDRILATQLALGLQRERER